MDSRGPNQETTLSTSRLLSWRHGIGWIRTATFHFLIASSAISVNTLHGKMGLKPTLPSICEKSLRRHQDWMMFSSSGAILPAGRMRTSLGKMRNLNSLQYPSEQVQ